MPARVPAREGTGEESTGATGTSRRVGVVRLFAWLSIAPLGIATACRPAPAPPESTGPQSGGPGPGEPVAIAVDWGETPCASCRMPVADASFAAGCLDGAGTPHVFDDVGCLVIEMGTGRLVARDVRVRHVREDRWIPVTRADFVRHPGTPMGFGYAAVDRGRGELSFEAVQAEMGERFGLGGE